MKTDDSASNIPSRAMPSPAHDDANFEPVDSCALCGAEERSTRFRDGRFEVVRCAACGLVYVTPRLNADSLPAVYDADYWRSPSPKDRGYADYIGDEALYLRTYRRRYQLVRRFAPRAGRALDVGCAAGYFLKVLSDSGWQVAGVELSPEIAARAGDACGPDAIHVGELRAGCFDQSSFDLITCWDVVEHVRDPVALLRTAHSLLKPDGCLIVETQNVESCFARLLGPRWQHYKHLEHLYHFSPSTLRLLLEKSGFERVFQTSRFGGKHVSIGFVLERATRLHPAMRYLLLPLSPFESFHAYVNVFDELVVVARKASAASATAS